MFTKTATSLSVLSILMLPLLACAMIQAVLPTPPPAKTATSTPTIPARAIRQTSVALTRVARRALLSPTRTLAPVTPILARLPSGTPTPSLTVSPVAPQVYSVSISAPALANNLLGEALERDLVVYLPASYSSESQKRYPVVYYLLDFGVQSVPVALRPEGIQKDIEAGYVKEMMIVIVSGVNTLGGSFYVNSPVTGNWDGFVAQDVVGYVDAHYRTIARPASRGIGGNGMGGFGALSLAMRHPDVFGAVYSLSPYLFDDNGLADSPVFSPPGMADGFVDLQARESLLPPDEAVSDMQNNAGEEQFALAYGAAFVPDPQAGPPYVDYPYRRQNGQLSRDEAIWKRWQAGFGDIPDKVQAHKENLLKLNGITIDYGANDPYRWLPRGCQYFSAQLTAIGVPNQLVSFLGDPQASLEQRIRAFMLPFFSEKLVFEN
ncbi:MAG: alpha/beta hydrolase-fold protein [Anaerolineales bacterium]